jgi:endo-beta-N-acetylglucosaminidase D
MSIRPWRWVVSLVIALGVSPLPAQSLPGQPYVGYWFPNTLLSWDPATDPDAPYNRSSVPLGVRFANPALNVNPHAQADRGRVTALVAFAPTSFNPSQGAATMGYYALNYWQYLDYLVFWGGSAGEGLILAPNSTVIDAAHRNGVPVLGNVFLPPNAFGGQIQWVHDFVQRDGVSFPVADKMIQAAEYYGFDGWFINQETSGADATLATDMQAMLEYFHAHSSLRIVWYDAMTQSGAIAYQNALNAQNQMFFADSANVVSNDMFLNFNWSSGGLASSGTLATSLGRSPYELYAGVDVQSNGYNTPVNWNGLFPEGSPHAASLGLYRPEWTFTSSSSVADFYTRDNRMWVGATGDPSNTTTSAAWKGIANYLPATSPIATLPFVTNFNTGQGSQYAIDGGVLAQSDWNNLSLQDVLPTWRWIVRSTGSRLAPALDWSDAYWGGTSLKVSGTLDAVNDLTLYETQLAIDANSAFTLAYKTGAAGAATHLQIGLAFDDAPATFEYLDVGNATSAGWNTGTFDLSAYAGRTLAVIALRFNPDAAAQPYTIHLGRLGVYDTPLATPRPPARAQLISKNETTPDIAALRLQWTGSPDPVNSYNVLQRHADGSLSWLGGTPNTAYFVGRLARDGNEAASTIEIEAVSPAFVRSTAATVAVPWDSIFKDGFDVTPPAPRD